MDLVVTSGTRIGRQSDEKVEEGAPQRWKQITDAGPELVLMRGTPRPLDDVPDCLAEGNSPVECGPLATHISDTDPLASQNLPAGAHHIDMNEYVCPPEMVGDSDHCPSVVGNVAVYFDNSHLSNTFVATMTPLIEAELRGSVEWLFE